MQAFPSDTKSDESRLIKAKATFQGHGGILGTREAVKCGIHPRTLSTI